MRKYILSLMIIFIGTNSFAVEYLNQHQLREKLASATTDIKSNCSIDAQRIQNGEILNMLKVDLKNSEAKALSCNKQYEKALRRFCHLRLLTINQLEKIVSDQNMSELSKGFSVTPASTALGAVVLYKMRKHLSETEKNWTMRMSNLVEKSSCEALKQDANLIGLIKQFTDKISSELEQTTLSVE